VLSHPHIVSLKEVFLHETKLYLAYELLERDLFQMMEERRARHSYLDEEHIKVLLFQLLVGVNYIHKTGYFHRDLKPENLVLKGADEYLKITDFGIIREAASGPCTEYIATRWYRAPEVVLRSSTYDAKIDVFAVGCIMAELFMLAPLFPGSSELDQLSKLCQVLGTPSKEEWPEGCAQALKRGLTFPAHRGQDLSLILKYASPEAVDLLECLLKWNPNHRYTCEQALFHPFFSNLDQAQLTRQLAEVNSMPTPKTSKMF